MNSHGCNRLDHLLSRRQFVVGASTSAGLLGFREMLSSVDAQSLRRQDKRALVIFLSGGVSQLETWDPKPGADTGGPFREIQTTVPGLRISELLPHTATQMHRLAVIRGLNTAEDDHGKGAYIMQTGRRQTPAEQFPQFGTVVAKLNGSDDSPIPGHIHITPPGQSGFNRGDAAFLGPRYGSVTLADGNPPPNLLRPPTLTETANAQRNEFRERLNRRFAQTHRSADTEAYANSFVQAQQVIQRRTIFDLQQEPLTVRQRYGEHEFGRHCLLARRLLEQGVTFVKVTHSNYDSHHENFDFHIEQLGEFDRTFAILIDDLHQRGMLESTLVIVMSEFGRTPTINRNLGRDHWSRAWSIALGGCGIQPGAVIGRTNANGTAVTDRQVHGGHLFHTYFRALGLNPTRNHFHDGRPIPMADPQASAIQEVLL